MNYAEFHQGLHCLIRQKRSSDKEIQFLGTSMNRGPLIDHSKCIELNQKEESIST